jgi:transcriptional regulator with XRE-family HTH domain
MDATGPTTVIPVPNLTRLRELRMKQALTQAELADRSGVSRGTIIRLEQGDPNVLPSTLRKLARALKVRPAQLWEK